MLRPEFVQFRSDTRLRIASGIGVPFTPQQITFGISLGIKVSQEYGNAKKRNYLSFRSFL
jgi:hypothetical protein